MYVKHVYLKSLELSVFSYNKIYLENIKLKTNKEIGQRATLKLSLREWFASQRKNYSLYLHDSSLVLALHFTHTIKQ